MIGQANGMGGAAAYGGVLAWGVRLISEAGFGGGLHELGDCGGELGRGMMGYEEAKYELLPAPSEVRRKLPIWAQKTAPTGPFCAKDFPD